MHNPGKVLVEIAWLTPLGKWMQDFHRDKAWIMAKIGAGVRCQ